MDTKVLKILFFQVFEQKKKKKRKGRVTPWVYMYSSWVWDLQRELASRFGQLCRELDEVDPSTVHCPLRCAAALSRTFNQHRFGPGGCSSVCLVILFNLRFQRGLAVHQHPGQEQHTQGLQDGMLGKSHVHPESLLLRKHTDGEVSSNIGSASALFPANTTSLKPSPAALGPKQTVYVSHLEDVKSQCNYYVALVPVHSQNTGCTAPVILAQ